MKKILIGLFLMLLAVTLVACGSSSQVDCQLEPNHASCIDSNTDSGLSQRPIINFNASLPTRFDVGSAQPNWLDYVNVTDGNDGTIELSLEDIDLSAVNMSQPGAFSVQYTARNSRGLTTSRSLLIIIEENEIPFGDCDPNFQGETELLSFSGAQVRFASYMRNFLDPFSFFAKRSELNQMKRTCFTRAQNEHNTSIQWVSYFNDLNHWNEIINNHIAGDHKADLYNINSHYLGRLARAGAIRPITEYVEKYMPDYYWDSNRQIGSWNGEIYGFWNERHNVNMGIYVNLDLINEYSQSNPAELWQNGEWNWDAFAQMAQEVKANAPANFKIFGINSYHAGSYFIGSNGGQVINPNTDTFEFNNPRTVRALEFLREMTALDYLYFAEEGDSQTRAEFSQGNMLFYFGADWISGDTSILKPGGAIQFKLGMVPFPVGPDIIDIAQEYRLPISVSALWVIRGNATDAEAERLVQFFANKIPWGNDEEQDFRYYQTMEDHMDDLTSLEAYISVSRLGYYDKTFLYGLVWAEIGQDELAPGVGNLFSRIALGESISGTIDAALPSLNARIRESRGMID